MQAPPYGYYPPQPYGYPAPPYGQMPASLPVASAVPAATAALAKPPQKSWIQKHGAALIAALILIVGIVFLVLAGVQYNTYHKQTDKNSTKAKNAKTLTIVFVIVAAACLIIGGFLAWRSAKSM